MLSPTFWKKYFKVYDYLNELLPYTELLEQICTYASIHAGDHVLDLGSGTGNLSLKAEKMGALVTGIDFSQAGQEIHLKKNPNATLLLGDVSKKLPFPDNSFDAVVSNNVLYAIPRTVRSEVFRELYRILKPGGRIVLSNIIEGFSPWAIYRENLKKYRAQYGQLALLVKITSIFFPTLQVFYYNFRVQMENKNGMYDFFLAGEQAQELSKVGFKEISNDIKVYCGQAVLNYALK